MTQCRVTRERFTECGAPVAPEAYTRPQHQPIPLPVTEASPEEECQNYVRCGNRAIYHVPYESLPDTGPVPTCGYCAVQHEFAPDDGPSRHADPPTRVMLDLPTMLITHPHRRISTNPDRRALITSLLDTAR